MTEAELDAVMAGCRYLDAVLVGPNGEERRVTFTRHDLAHPVAMRAAWRRQTGREMPHYDQADHDEIVRVMARLADAGASS
jgi:hypothetical protein